MEFGLILLVILFGAILIISQLQKDNRNADKVILKAVIYDQENEKIGEEKYSMDYDEYREHIKKADTNKKKTDDKKDGKSRKRRRPQ